MCTFKVSHFLKNSYCHLGIKLADTTFNGTISQHTVMYTLCYSDDSLLTPKLLFTAAQIPAIM